METRTESKQRPAAVFAAHPVEATVWENETVVGGKRVATYAVRLAAVYKDASGTMKSAHSLRIDELPKALYVLARAYAALLKQQLGTIEEKSESQGVGEGRA